MAHGELYAAEFGWDASFEALVARIVADYAADHDPARERAWIAELDGRRVGSVFCVRKDAATAQLRILLVDPVARGCGLGRRLVAECVRFARQPATSGWCCGQTIHLPRPAGSTSPPGSAWSRRSATTASAST